MLNFRAAENHCAFVHDLAVVAVAPSSSTPTTSRLEDDIFFNQTFVQKNSGFPLLNQCASALGGLCFTPLNSVRMLRRAALVSANRCAAARHMSSQPPQPGSPYADERETFATVSGGEQK